MKPGRRIAALVFATCIGPLHAADLRLHAVLDGGTVISATDSKATGEATAILHDDGKVRINLVFGGLASNVTGAALHTGTKAENGPAVMPLDVRKDQTVGSLVNSEVTLGADAAASMRAGDTYIVITTIDYPAGAIRGQLIPQPVRLQTPAQTEPEESR